MTGGSPSEPEPALFYTGLVADLYGALRSSVSDPEPYARFIAASGEPALELGCGDGEPLLELRSRGLDVEGLDSSPDMLARCRAAAAERGLDVVLHQQAIEAMDLAKRYRSIFLAGPTFNLLADDETAQRALARIARHLDDGGSALVPLFVPEASTEHLGRTREARGPDGERLRVTAIRQERDEGARRQTMVLRYEREVGGVTSVVERPWVLHWYGQAEFGALAFDAGLTTAAVLDPDGRPADDDASTVAFWLTLLR